MASLHHHFVQITCPDTGRPIMVARSLRDNPIGALYSSNRISKQQYDGAIAYQEDIEALTGQLRAASTGPDDLAWRQQRPNRHRLAKHRKRIEAAHARLGPDRSKLVKSILVDGNPKLISSDLGELHQALDRLAVAYGLPVHHHTETNNAMERSPGDPYPMETTQ